MSKIENKARRMIGNKVHKYQTQGANEFMQFACSQNFKYRFSIAKAILTGRPIRLEKVI